MGRKKNKFEKLEFKDEYGPNGGQSGSNRGGADSYKFRKAERKPSVKKPRAQVPRGIIKPHILMLCVFLLCAVLFCFAPSELSAKLSENSRYLAYAGIGVAVYLIPCVIYAAVMKKRPRELYIKGFSPSSAPFAAVSLLLLISLTALEKYYIAYNFSYRAVQALPYGSSVPEVLFVNALLPAVLETLLVNGALQSEYSAFGGGITGIFASAAVFSLLHFDLRLFGVYFTAGLVLGTVTHVTGSVFPAMLIHFVNNLAAMFLADGMTFIASERIGGPFLMIVLCILCFVLLLIQLQMMEKRCMSLYAKGASGESIPDKPHFFSPERATGRRFIRLVFSPAMIAAFVVFWLCVR